MNLKPGDCLYFGQHFALGFLIESREEEGEVYWTYALRSPPKEDLTNVLVSIRKEKESNFISAVEEGRLQYYEGSKKNS